MKFGRSPSLLLATALCCTVFSGCSKSPSGTPGNALAPNRLTVQMRLQSPVNNSYLYAFAFDDDDVSADGPTAIVGAAAVPNNGIVAGSFTVLVVYEAGTYTVYRRTDLGGGAETLDRASRAFVTTPSPVFGDTIQFTLDLDAVTDSGVRLFRADARKLDVNFVTTNERRRVVGVSPRIAYDALGANSASSYGTFEILGASSYNYTNASTGVNEPTNDVYNEDTTGTIDPKALDITDFSISILRSS